MVGDGMGQVFVDSDFIRCGQNSDKLFERKIPFISPTFDRNSRVYSQSLLPVKVTLKKM